MFDPTDHEVKAPDLDPPEPEHSEDNNVCDVCFGDNLLKEVGITECAKCCKPFCIHYCSKIDPQYCIDCMSDISVTKDDVTKTYEHYNELTDTTRRYTRKCRQIKIDGQDWLFAQRKIATLSDAELEMVTEYHRTMLQLLLTESEERKMARLHRYSQVKMAAATVTTTTTVQKTVQTKTDKSKEKLAAVMSALLAQGFTAEQIAAMAGAKK